MVTVGLGDGGDDDDDRNEFTDIPFRSLPTPVEVGIVSIEAQHSGCRVIASDDGGLPETDCGGVMLVAPDNAEALAWGIRAAIDSGPFPLSGRQRAGTMFTVEQSVNALLTVVTQPQAIPPATIVRQLEELIQAPSAEEPRVKSVW